MLENSYMLRAWTSNLDSPAPIDKLVFFKEVEFDANNEAVVDISEYKFPALTKIYYTVLNSTGVYPRINGVSPATTGEFGRGNIVISSYQAPVAIDASVAADGDVPAVVVPSSEREGVVAMVMFIADCNMVTKGAI